MFKWITPALLSLFAITATQVHSAPLIGIAANIGSGTHETDFKNWGDAEADIDTSFVNIHLGFNSARNNRFIIGYETGHLKDDSSEKYELSGIRFDWEFVYGEDFAQPYFGLGFGYYNSEDLDPYNGESLDGYSLQVAGGVKLNAHKHVEFDLRAQYQGIFWQEMKIMNPSAPGERYTETTTHFSVGAGVAFKF